MSAYERLLAPGSTELPECRCGKEMQLTRIEELPDRTDAQIRIYNCSACHHEMRLTVWSEDLPISFGRQGAGLTLALAGGISAAPRGAGRSPTPREQYDLRPTAVTVWGSSISLMLPPGAASARRDHNRDLRPAIHLMESRFVLLWSHILGPI